MKAGWVSTTLGESCNIYQPKTITAKEMVADGAYPVFGANGVIGRYDKYNHEEPQLLITCRGATCGSVNVSDPFSWITGNAMVVRPQNTSFDLKFLEYLFRGGIDVSKSITGAAQPQITRTNLAPLEFSYPETLHEQHRIVALLDEAFDGIATAKANAETNLQNARALFESHLQSIFTQRGEGWVEKRLGDERLLQMIDGDRGANYPKAADFLDDGPCLFLNTKNVRPDGFEFESTMFISAEKDRQLRKGKLKRDDVVMTTRGTIGNIGLYSEDVPFDSIRINSGMLVFRPNQREILPSYLFEILRSGIVKEQIRKYTTGAAQPQLPIKTLVNFTVPVPVTLAAQSELVKRIHAFEPEAQRLESLYQQKLTALDNLKKSLLHQAFSGQL